MVSRDRKERSIMTDIPDIKIILFDFGGVLAEEGFKGGILAIAEKNNLNPEDLIKTAFDMVYELGFTSGRVKEDAFWAALRLETGIRGTNEELKDEILSRFVLRPWMLEIVSELKEKGFKVGILSDQTHWLDELNGRNDFFHFFDYVFNSYHLGETKKDPVVFDYALKSMNVMPESVLFIDDHVPNLKRARTKGIQTMLYMNKETFFHELQRHLS